MQNSETITKEILTLEKKFWTAMKDHDLKTALALTDFPCIVAGSHGAMSVDQKQFEEMFNSGNETVRTFEFEEDKAEVRLLSPETAVIAYKVHTTMTNADQDKTIDAVDTSTWVRRDNKWLCAMHTETQLVPQ